MTWLDEVDLHAVRDAGWVLSEAHDAVELRRAALGELARLVPADLISWNEIDQATGEIEHEPMPIGAEPPDAFAHVSPSAARHPLLHPHAVHPGSAVRLSDAVARRGLQRSELYAELLHRSGSEYGMSIGIRSRPREAVVVALGRHERQFSERDRDVLDLVRPGLEQALHSARARARLGRALASAPPAGTAVVLLDRYGEIERSGADAERWLAEHFGRSEHPGWLPPAVAGWLAVPPRPPLVSVRDGRRLTVRLVLGDPHALLLDEEIDDFRSDALDRLGLTAREREVLDAGRDASEEAAIADQLFLSMHAVWERLERLEQKLGVDTLADAVAAARRASL
jgi:DNA-binding CsgD family transcriptional regulator